MDEPIYVNYMRNFDIKSHSINMRKLLTIDPSIKNFQKWMEENKKELKDSFIFSLQDDIGPSIGLPFMNFCMEVYMQEKFTGKPKPLKGKTIEEKELKKESKEEKKNISAPKNIDFSPENIQKNIDDLLDNL